MAIPGGNTNFTPTPEVGVFLPPNDLVYNPTSQIIWGGIAINDPSAGRQYQYWETFYDVSDIKVKPVTGSVEFTHNAPNAITVSGAFDQNMAAVVAWQTATTSNIYYFGVGGYTTLTISDTTSCRITVDDERDYYASASDIFFVYTKNDNLYYRIQRENYANEYFIGQSYGKKIKRMGLTDKNRFQFELLV
jgi:hypothetical protein